jgi:hypothetical protein
MITCSDDGSACALVQQLQHLGQITDMNQEYRALGLTTPQVHDTDPASGGNRQPGDIDMTSPVLRRSGHLLHPEDRPTWSEPRHARRMWMQAALGCRRLKALGRTRWSRGRFGGSVHGRGSWVRKNQAGLMRRPHSKAAATARCAAPSIRGGGEEPGRTAAIWRRLSCAPR